MKHEFRVTHRDPFDPRGKPQRFCGTSAASALTGYTSECVAAWINAYRLRPIWYQVQGTYIFEVARAMKELGYRVIEQPTKRGMTWRQWNEAREPAWATPMLVNVTNHFVALYQGTVVDSGNPGGVHWRDYRRPKQRVVRCWTVEPRQLGKPPRKREPLPKRRLRRPIAC